MRKTLLTVIAMVLLAALQVAPASADAGSANVELIRNIPHTSTSGGGGADLEFIDVVVDAGTEFERTVTVGALGVYNAGMHLYDVTNPEDVSLISVYDCNITQGDVQLFTREDLPGRTFATYTSDTVANPSPCYDDALALGQFSGRFGAGNEDHGTFIVEITDPANPTTVSFVNHPQGSHNMTVHPTGMYLFNSNSDLITSALPAIEITDIADIDNPVAGAEFALPTRPGLGTESHDVTFNADGSRAYSAALSQTVILDTEDPLNPVLVSSFVDPQINVEHQANPVTIADPILGEREFLIVEDEFAGAAGGDPCPSGGVHVYDITGDLENTPVKVGYWNIGEARYPGADTEDGEILGRCTAHVFEIHEEEALMTMAFYNGGVRVIDISGLVGLSTGDLDVPGMREIGFYRAAQADTWAVKAPYVDRDGVFYMYGNDQNTGMDVYKVDLSDGADANATGLDVWLSGDDLLTLPQAELPSDYTPYCLLGQAVQDSPVVAIDAGVGKAFRR